MIRSLLFAVVLITTLASFSTAFALNIGPAQTKRERDPRFVERPRSVPKVTFEQIEENFLREDFRAVLTLSEQYLTVRTDIQQTEEVRYLQALALLKLGRTAEGRKLLEQLETHAVSPTLQARAAMSVADSFYFNHETLEGEILYRSALEKHPSLREAMPSSVRPAPEPARRPLQQSGFEERALYSVQVGSFSSQSNAQRMLDRLLRSRYDAYVSQDAASHLLRVRVGRMESREEAMSMEKRLQADGYPTRIFP